MKIHILESYESLSNTYGMEIEEAKGYEYPLFVVIIENSLFFIVDTGELVDRYNTACKRIKIENVSSMPKNVPEQV